MTGDTAMMALALLAALILPASALFVRRIPMRRFALLAAIWLTIFAVAALAISLLHPT